MPGPWDHINVDQTFTLGGTNTDGLVVGPFLWPTSLEIYAWHTGVKTGEGNSAYLVANYEGEELMRVEDRDFDNYSLPIARKVLLSPLATTSVSIAYGNHMAEKRSHGLQVTVKRVA